MKIIYFYAIVVYKYGRVGILFQFTLKQYDRYKGFLNEIYNLPSSLWEVHKEELMKWKKINVQIPKNHLFII